MKIRILALLLFTLTAGAQPISYFNSIFLQQQNAAQDRAYLGIGGTNLLGSGTVTNFTATGFPPLFSSSVTTPTTFPHLTFTALPVGSNVVYAGPDMVTGLPTFRRLTANDLPGSGGSGTVTSFSSGDLSPIFTTTVATPTTTPALSYNLTSQSANTVFAGPTSGGSSAPTFRALVAGDIPSLSGTYLPLAGGTMSGTINLASSGVNFGSTPMFQESANVVAMRNGTTPQTLEVYNTFTDASNYRRGFLGWSGADFHIGTQSAGTGTSSGNLSIDAGGTHRIIFRANSTDLWTIADPTGGGAFFPLTDNVYDIGDGSTPRRPHIIYAGTSMVAPEFDGTTVNADNLHGLTGDTVKLNGPLQLNAHSADGRILDDAGNTIIDANGGFENFSGSGVKTAFVFTDTLSGRTGDAINMPGNIVLQDGSGAGNIQDKTGFTLVDSHGNFAGNGGGLTNIVLGVTNATFGVGVNAGTTLISKSNLNVIAIKSLTAGSGVSFSDTPTNITISASGGGGSATNLIDYYMTNLTSYANSSNYFIDFAFPSAVLTSATNVIAFNYSTNWGLANTSRVCNITVPPTNFGRIVTFSGLATNWHIQPMIYFVPLGYAARFLATQVGPGETNVLFTPFIDSVLTTSNTTASFNPTNAFPNSGGLGAKVWLDASVKAWQDEWLTVPAIDGAVVRGWTDLSGFTGMFTNMITTELNTFYRAPQTGPYNVPSMRIYPGQSGAFCWMQAPSTTALTQPTWGFVMYYGRSGGNVIDSTGGGRFAINPGEMGQGSSFFCSAGISYTAAKTASWTLVSCEGNGVSGLMRTNGVQAVSGNAGTTSPSQFIIFGDNVKTVMVGEYHVAEILLLNTNLTATQLTNVESYFYRKYPFWNPPTVQ